MRPERIGLGITLAMHALAAAALLSYEPARKAMLAAAPIMIEIINPPRVEPPKPTPPTELPRPRPVARHIEQLVEPPILTAPAEAPSPVMAPPPSPAPAPAVVAVAPAPLPVSAPVFNADYLENPAPPYPGMSRRMREEGKVVLRVHVTPGGAADEVQVRTSSGFGRLDDAARDTVQRWKFVPAKRGAEAVPAWVLIPISFRLEG
ncbi:MAG TPA: energy transducer TonB [Burkholderiales bacterium]|nr:energy transducer TonB [Burkholderiales bacterium]